MSALTINCIGQTPPDDANYIYFYHTCSATWEWFGMIEHNKIPRPNLQSGRPTISLTFVFMFNRREYMESLSWILAKSF